MIYVTNRPNMPAGCIMVTPPTWAITAGLNAVDALVPPNALHSMLFALVESRKGGSIDAPLLEQYRNRYRRHLFTLGEAGKLSPGALVWRSLTTGVVEPVPQGASLFCTCSRSEAAADRCHRCWATAALRHYGWDVRADWEAP